MTTSQEVSPEIHPDGTYLGDFRKSHQDHQ